MHIPFARFLLEESLQLLDAVVKAVVLLLHRGKVLFPCFDFPQHGVELFFRFDKFLLHPVLIDQFLPSKTHVEYTYLSILGKKKGDKNSHHGRERWEHYDKRDRSKKATLAVRHR
jgi:hypothetical protein